MEDKKDWQAVKARIIAGWETKCGLSKKILRWSREWITEGVLVGRYRPVDENDRRMFKSKIREMVKSGELIAKKASHGRNGLPFVRYINAHTLRQQVDLRSAADIHFMSAGSAHTFDVSQRCIMLLVEIQHAITTGAMRGGEYRLSLSDDASILIVSCEKEPK